ncbi:hypothetical protein RIF29_29841 [Crotalaria pallida]|uniref:Uncharacterized protein n=1 Tax=Crotalaria pallida TaxID=3830 RepID=A0AAN9EF91_CROPI
MFRTIDTWLIWQLTDDVNGGLHVTDISNESRQACIKGEAKSTYETSAFILLNPDGEVVKSTHGLLTTVSFKLGKDTKTSYALEGSIPIVGAAL